jgi:uncharacterized protein involved in tolerance to divalent cations
MEKIYFVKSITQKMEAAYSSETSVNTYQIPKVIKLKAGLCIFIYNINNQCV